VRVRLGVNGLRNWMQSRTGCQSSPVAAGRVRNCVTFLCRGVPGAVTDLHFRSTFPRELRREPEAQLVPQTNALLDVQFAPELLCQQRYEL
jgi:hypothetical protein